MTIIKIIADAAGLPTRHAGMYVRAYTPDTDEHGLGELVTTPYRADALRFADMSEALAFWKQQSVRCPWRDDGKANRPLTAYTVLFDKEEVGAT